MPKGGTRYYPRARKELTTERSPRGTFVFPKLIRPDKTYKKEYGEYQVTLELEGQEAEDFRKHIEELLEDEYSTTCQELRKTKLKRCPDTPIRKATEKDGTEIPGKLRFVFKRKGGGKTGEGEVYAVHIPLYNARKEIIKPKSIWGGTIGNINFTVVPWFTDALGFGIRLEINAVQILSLVEAGVREASDYGFEDESDEFDTDDTTDEDTDSDVSDEDREDVGPAEGGVEF